MLLTLATCAAMVCGIRCPEPPRGRIADGIYTPSATWSGEAFVHAVERWTITDVGSPD